MQSYTIRITEAQRALIARLLADNVQTVSAYANCGSTREERDHLDMLPDMFNALPDDEIIDRPVHFHDFAEGF